MYKMLYGTNKDGSYKTWSIAVEGNKITISHGKMGGKQTLKEELVYGKNIGRANETSDEQQALLEAESRYKKQLDKGYRPSLDELDELDVLPMLAQDYLKNGHKLTYPVLCSPKKDGVRCLAIRHVDGVELRSRGGKEYTVPHIQKALFDVLKEGEILDGEIWLHSTPLEDIVSATRLQDSHLHTQLQYHAFDYVEQNVPFVERYAKLENIFNREELNYGVIVLVKHIHVYSEKDMLLWHKHYVSLGEEGIMLRGLEGLYESGKRSTQLQKRKDFLDEEFVITGVEEDRNGNAVLKVWCPVAKQHFGVCYGDFNERKQQLEHPDEYVGKWLNVKFQSRYRDTLLPSFPTGVCIRACTEDGTPLE